MKEWLNCHYPSQVDFEYQLPERRRLDAALWPMTKKGNRRQGGMDIALEWEWDNNKVAKDFPAGDFRKLLEVKAQSGLAIIHTRVDRKRRSTQADETIQRLLRSCRKYRQDSRSVALIEIQRVLHQNERVEFHCYSQDLDTPKKKMFAHWIYP
jgi:hypothetical protein